MLYSQLSTLSFRHMIKFVHATRNFLDRIETCKYKNSSFAYIFSNLTVNILFMCMLKEARSKKTYLRESLRMPIAIVITMTTALQPMKDRKTRKLLC